MKSCKKNIMKFGKNLSALSKTYLAVKLVYNEKYLKTK